MSFEFSVQLIPVALMVFGMGSFLKVAPFVFGRRRYKAFSETEIEIQEAPIFRSLIKTAVTPITTFGIKANPLRTISWFLFHLGMIILVVHGFLAGWVLMTWYGLGPETALSAVLYIGMAKGAFLEVFETISGVSALVGAVGLMYFRISGKTGGMLAGVDGPTSALGTRTRGLGSLNDILILLLVILGIVTGMAVKYVSGTFLGLHLLSVLILLALFPFTRLFHAAFYYWIGLYYGVLRNMRRITA